MAKRDDRMLLLWPLLTAAVDYVVLVGAIVLSYVIRFHQPFTNIIPIRHVIPSFGYYVDSALVGAGFVVLFLAMTGVYRISFRLSVPHEIARAVGRYMVAFALLMAALFFYRDFLYSRVVALLSLLLGATSLAIVRVVFGALRSAVFPANPLRRALLTGPFAEEVADRLRQAPRSGLSVLGVYPHLNQADLARQVEEEEPDTVILAYPFGDFSEARRVIENLGGKRLLFLFAPDPAGFASGRLATLTIAGLPVLRLREDPLQGWNGLIKRGFDVIVSFFLLAVLSPIILLLALLVKLSSKGPVIYKQTRVGLDGRPFTIFKFRSMRTDAETESGPVWAKPGDTRTTAIGGWMRRWSLDELPQLFNVLRGDMSLVGPRPERPEFVSQFEEKVPQYIERHRVRAGMTGWAQVNGLRGQAPIEQRTRYDVYYVENWSLMLDLRILAKTMVAVVAGRDAY